MRSSDEIIEILNDCLTAELTAINQYFVDAKMCANWGFERKARHFHDESIGEMKHADTLIARILYFEGVPNMQRLGPVRVGETVVEKLNLALDLEKEAIVRLNLGIGACVAEADNGTRHLLESVLVDEEEHADFLETQLELVRQLGDALYLTQQVED